jgi:hypothetical protein
MLWIFIGFNALPVHSDKSDVMERLWAMTGTQLRSFEDTGGNLPKVLVTSDLSLALTRSCVHLARFSSLNNLGSSASSINASLHPHRPYLSSLHLTSRVSSSPSSGLRIHPTRHPLRRGPPRRRAEQNRSEGKRGSRMGRSCPPLLQAEPTHSTHLQSGIQVQRP